MTSTLFHTADLLHSQDSLSVQWRSAPGEVPRPAEAALQERIAQQLKALAEAERALGPTVSTRVDVAQRQLGLSLYHLLDGPERALQRRVDSSRSSGQPLHLIIRLRSSDRKALDRHPALRWQLQLLTSPSDGPLSLMPGVTLSVQLGEVEPSQPVLVPGGRLQVLFMAYSPWDTQPVLDYEAEEERILTQLAPFVEERRLLLRVAEEGTLAELRRRLMRRPYDIVHLTGHGVVTDKGPRLVMEDETGARDDISPEQLLKVLKDGRKLPRLVVISSCHSAEQSDDLPSLAAELIQGGIPCVVGWTRPVLDKLATEAAAELYHRLCCGEVPAQAVAQARQRLQEEDKKKLLPTHTWATLQYLTTQPAGFALDPEERPARDESPTPEVVYRMLGSRMRVLERGFVGRRRELQALGRILRRGRGLAPGGVERPVAGATIVGMKGQGKSCLAGRAIERFSQDVGEVATVVLHGKLSEFELLEAFRQAASRSGDNEAEVLLADSSQPWMRRLERLLRHHWRERRLVMALDDFEQNLDIPGEGEAQLQPLAAELLEVLVPVCRDEQPKVLITTTARFVLPTRCQGALVEMTLGALDSASINKLWMRGQGGDKELLGVTPSLWAELCERLGRNARILDWARQLLGGKTPKEVRTILGKAGQALPKWQGEVPDKTKQDELAALFLKHMALEEAQAKVGRDALAFVERARVYEVPVPAEALSRLTEGLTVSLERHLVALANLGLLEVGSEEGQTVYRVSPLVKEKFDALDGERWHGVAAEFWWKVADRGDSWHTPALFQAWQHALQAKRQDIADEVADILSSWLDTRGEYTISTGMGMRHIEVFPSSVTGLSWTGYALFRVGSLQEGQAFLVQGIKLAEYLLAKGGEYQLTVKQRLSVCLQQLAGVLSDQGNLAEARFLLECSFEIKKQVFGTEVHPEIAILLHALAGVRRGQGDPVEARVLLERSLEIHKQALGTESHLTVAASLHSLAALLRDQGNLTEARALLERSLEIQRQVLGTEFHFSVAVSLTNLAGVLGEQGALEAARSILEHSLVIYKQVLGTEFHPSIATSYAGLGVCLHELGNLDEGEAALRKAQAIRERVYGTRDHYMYAETEVSLAFLLLQRERQEEALPLMSHAKAVLEAQVPNHPLLAQLRVLFPGPSVNLPELARLALTARASGTTPPMELIERLQSLRDAGTSHNVVADFLDQVAGGSPLPLVPADLPEEVAAFIATVREAAEELPVPA
jgi:tetratricopeptide (TPR) repeat protein